MMKREMKKIILGVLLLLIVNQTGFTQILDKTKLDTYFKRLGKNNKFMGSVAVSKNGELIYAKSIGYADIENNIRASEKKNIE